MKVARLYAVDDIRVEEAPRPVIGDDEALVRTRVCGICTGDIMGWYLQRKAPLVFGHEPTGEVVAVGSAVDSVRVGDRVFVHHHAPCGTCRHCRRGHHVHCPTWRSTRIEPGGMAEYFKVGPANLAADTLALPVGVGFEAGSLIEPAACVVKSLRRGGLVAGETLVVIGLGIMGQMHVALAKAAGARVIGVDLVPSRLERAVQLGADAVVDIRHEELPGAVRNANDGDLADVVVVGPGSIDAIRSGITAAGAAARVVLFTCSEPGEVLDLKPHDLYFEEISLVPSYSCGPDDTRQALEHLRCGDLSAQALITHRYPLEQIQQAFAMAANVDEALKTVIAFD